MMIRRLLSVAWLGLCPMSSFAEPAGFCAAVRGNGELALAQSTALARLVETYGPLRGYAGGSSAALTLFLYESMSLNPFLSLDDESTVGRRSHELALLLKSLPNLVRIAQNTPEGRAVGFLLGQGNPIREQMLGISADLASLSRRSDPEAARRVATLVDSITAITQSGNFQRMLNPKAIEFVREAFEAPREVRDRMVRFRVKELLDGVSLIGAYDARDKGLFVRPGVVNFDALAQVVGQVGNFYAAYNVPSSARGELRRLTREFLECAAPGRGKLWEGFQDSDPNGRGVSCGERFAQLHRFYQSANDGYGGEQQRVYDQIGAGDLGGMIITSVISGRAVQQFHAVQAAYFKHYKGLPRTLFKPDWEDVKIGYFGPEDVIANFAEQRLGDAKSEKFVGLGPATWLTALSTSPAEPGLSPIREIPGFDPETYLSAGGWADLHPVLALRAQPQCRRVVYVTRKGGPSKYAQGVAIALGLGDQLWEDILTPDEFGRYRNNDFGIGGDTFSHWGRFYNLANPESSFSLALQHADAVYGTDWDVFPLSRLRELLVDSYFKASMYVRAEGGFSDFFGQGDQANYFRGAGPGVIGLSTLEDYPDMPRPYVGAHEWPEWPGVVPQFP